MKKSNFNEKVINKQADKLWEEYKSGMAKKWMAEKTSTYEKCLEFAYEQAEAGALKGAIIKEESKKSLKFESDKIKNRYNTYRNYLVTRCQSLPKQIEKKFSNCEANHIASRCRGMSNYIEIQKLGKNDKFLDSIVIRISDHNSTGSGSDCNHYIYIQDKTWMEIKKKIFEIAENFLK